MTLSNWALVGLLVLFICALGGLLDGADAQECEHGTAKYGPDGGSLCDHGKWVPMGPLPDGSRAGSLYATPSKKSAPADMPAGTVPMTRIPPVIDLDGWAGVDVIYGGQRIHISREQIGHWAGILSHTCDPAVVGNCTALGLPDHELRKSKP